MAAPARQLAQRRPSTRGGPPAPRVRPARPARVTRRAPRRRARRVPFALFAVAIVSALVLAVTGAQALVAQRSFRIEELARSTERLERGYGSLRLEAARLEAPERIERWARRAGLVLPDPDELRVVVVETRRPREAARPTAPALAAGRD